MNWATGLPGVQPKWEGEYSVFVGDLGREVSEGELVALFTPLFPSTKSAKIMYDPASGLSRGYGFVRFGDENDMQRSLALGQNTSGSGLSFRGRTLRISEASGSGGTRNRTTGNEVAGSASLMESSSGIPNGMENNKNPRDLHIQVPNPGNMNIAANGGGGGSGGDVKSPYGSNSSFAGPHRHTSSGTSPNLLSPNATGFSIPVASPSSPSHPSSSYPTSPLSPSADPNNTTVFVGGLPACISEDTLKSFFQHFGEITYVKIPPNKGCGFVQFVRRPDAELAIAKMHDFPIHGKSRIRLSWGRSQGDKQVEHVRKLANALSVPFEAVWRMVQGQDNSTIKQIASAVGGGGGGVGQGQGHARGGNGGGHGHGPGRPDPEAARADLARLTGDLSMQQRATIFDSMASLGSPLHGGGGAAGGGGGGTIQQQGGLPPPLPPSSSLSFSLGPNSIPAAHDSEAYAFRPVVPQALSPEHFGWAGPPRDNGPYSRVSPSSFAPMSTSNLGGHPQTTVPLSPSTSTSVGQYTHHHPHPHSHSHSHHLHQQSHAIGHVGSAYSPYIPLQLSTPASHPSPTNALPMVGPGGLSHAAAEAAGTPFDPRQWRQSATSGSKRGMDMEIPSTGQSFLAGSTNGRPGAGFDEEAF